MFCWHLISPSVNAKKRHYFLKEEVIVCVRACMYACITCGNINPVYPGHREGQDELTREVIVVDFRLGAHVIRGIVY